MGLHRGLGADDHIRPDAGQGPHGANLQGAGQVEADEKQHVVDGEQEADGQGRRPIGALADQALAAEWLLSQSDTLGTEVYVLPDELDGVVASLKLKA